MSDTNFHALVIKAFGGTSGVARAIGVDPKLTVHWPTRGIPSKYWAHVSEAPVPAEWSGGAITMKRLALTKPRNFARRVPQNDIASVRVPDEAA